MSFVAVAIGGAAVIGAVSAGMTANAQGKTAKAQLAEQRATRAAALQAANARPEELQQLQQSISLNNQDIARKEKILASADPAIIEAGKQALSLLRGEDAAGQSGLRASQAKQRAQLEAKLRAQLGPGYANTTAGIQALAAFDEQAGNVQSNAQQASLGQLLGVANQYSANGQQAGIQNSASLSSLYGNISARQVGAINGTPITAAGSQFAGQLAAGQAGAQISGQVASLAGMYGGYLNNGGGTPVPGGTGGGTYVNNNFTGPTGYLK